MTAQWPKNYPLEAEWQAEPVWDDMMLGLNPHWDIMEGKRRVCEVWDEDFKNQILKDHNENSQRSNRPT